MSEIEKIENRFWFRIVASTVIGVGLLYANLSRMRYKSHHPFVLKYNSATRSLVKLNKRKDFLPESKLSYQPEHLIPFLTEISQKEKDLAAITEEAIKAYEVEKETLEKSQEYKAMREESESVDRIGLWVCLGALATYFAAAGIVVYEKSKYKKRKNLEGKVEV